ncbi:methyltransferase [Marinobacter salinexigens]|uniref:methyltransferase n=1 Tax=Marinobacter salinexigens TaxID=2919747 RepID=UPI001FEAB7FA|nr:methyltransferase [Marinobacter salinexigens]
MNSRWQQLNDWLFELRDLWLPAPFMDPEPAWTRVWPELAELMAGLSDEQCSDLEEDAVTLVALVAEALPALAAYPQLVSLEELAPADDEVAGATLPEVRATDMPGRKRLQAGAFTAAISPLDKPVLDWCCGKGHLSRTLAARCPADVQGLEWNPELVREGNRLAERFGDPVTVHCQDVMDDGLALDESRHGVALHACGDLHRQLLRRGAQAGLSRISLSPCCYHLTTKGRYQPMSQSGRGHRPELSVTASDLRLAVRETVTAPTRVREQTKRMTLWRLGFDGLQRHLRGVDEYLPVPSSPTRLLHEGFGAFCRWAACERELVLPEDTDFQHWLDYGERRMKSVRRYELLRHLFRRPLELWMLFDYVLYLEEQGYQVRVGEFCSRTLTPRNLLIDAIRVYDTPPVPRSHP